VSALLDTGGRGAEDEVLRGPFAHLPVRRRLPPAWRNTEFTSWFTGTSVASPRPTASWTASAASRRSRCHVMAVSPEPTPGSGGTWRRRRLRSRRRPGARAAATRPAMPVCRHPRPGNSRPRCGQRSGEERVLLALQGKLIRACGTVPPQVKTPGRAAWSLRSAPGQVPSAVEPRPRSCHASQPGGPKSGPRTGNGRVGADAP